MMRRSFESESDLLDFLEQHFPFYPTRTLAEATGLTEKQINYRAYSRGWRKDKHYLRKELQRQAKRLIVVGKAHRFKKGIIPHNKGKKMPPEVYAKCAGTMFKPGTIPHNTREDGDISWRMDKRTGLEYAYIRISKSNWQLYHRVIWEKEHGPIPRGSVIVFRDGNTRNVALENLELITRAENMRRNSMWTQYPEDVAKAIQLISTIKRRIRNMEKKQTKTIVLYVRFCLHHRIN